MSADVDAAHRRILLASRVRGGGGSNDALALDFLRTQALAAALGFRRAWPAPDNERLQPVLASANREFAREMRSRALLLPSLDAAAHAAPPPPSAWPLWEGRMGGEGRLFRNWTEAPICTQHEAILEEYHRLAGSV